jgi:hypothetical protein
VCPGHLFVKSGINNKTNKLNIMKTKFLIPLIAGLGLLCACKGKSGAGADSVYLEKAKAKVSADADTVKVDQKLIKTADMHFQVKSVQQAAEQITNLAASFNGAVIHHLMNSTAGNSVDIHKSNDSILRVTIINSTADMTVKIPPANMENFMNQVAHLGLYVNNRLMNVSDKSSDYLATRLKLKNQNELVSNQKKEAANKKSPDDLLSFKNRMVDQRIENYRIDDSVKMSVVTLSFYESNVITKQVVANDDLAAYNLPFFKRMGISIANGWELFVDIIVGVANAWILLPVGLGIWLITRYVKNKKLAGVIKS